MSKQLNNKVFDFILGEAMEKYAKDIADEDVPYEMSEEEKAAMEQQKSRIYKKVLAKAPTVAAPRRKIRRKRIIILAAALIMLLALGLTTSAGRVFLLKTYTNMSGTDLKIHTSTVSNDQYTKIQKFQAKDEIIIPTLLPSDMKLVEIDDHSLFLQLRYEKGDMWFSITLEPIEKGSNSIQTENNTYKIEKCKILGMDAQLFEMTSELNFTAITVMWNSDDIQYTLDANMGKKELKTILAGLQYYKQ